MPTRPDDHAIYWRRNTKRIFHSTRLSKKGHLALIADSQKPLQRNTSNLKTSYSTGPRTHVSVNTSDEYQCHRPRDETS